MPQERVILDPAEKIEGRTELDITPWIDVEGVNWGDAEMQAYKAEAEVGESVIHYRLPNRQIGIPMVIKEQGGTSFATARSYIQAKAARYIQEGGVGKRILATGGTVYFDIVANGLTLGGDWLAANRGLDTEAELRIEAIPDFYEPEVEVASAEEKTATELIKVIPDPGGDMPARVRIVVEEKQGADQRGLIWSFRCREYSSATTAKVAYEAEELQAIGEARKAALTGASGGTVVQHGTISTNWTPIVGGRIGGTAFPTHTGTDRVLARVYSTSGTLARARLVWDVGDLVNPAENEAVRVPGASNFYIADLGEVRLDPPPVGTHRWDWQIQAAGDVGNEDFKVDKVWIINADEGMGVLSAPSASEVGGFSTYAARDEFNQASGTLNAKTLPTNQTWETSGGGATDLKVTGGIVERSTTAEAYRLALVKTTTLSAVAVQTDFKYSARPSTDVTFSLFARYSDASNLCSVELIPRSGSTVLKVRKNTTEGGGDSLLPVLGGEVLPASFIEPEAWFTLRLVISTTGAWEIWSGPAGGRLKLLRSGFDAVLATGGKLASGRVGFSDSCTSTSSVVRSFDNFAAWAPTFDAVVFASQKAQLTTEGMYRLDSGGTAYGPVPRVIGGLPRLPAGGLEGRSTELFLKASRGDLGELPDNAIDDLAVKAYAARSWLTVPGTI